MGKFHNRMVSACGVAAVAALSVGYGCTANAATAGAAAKKMTLTIGMIDSSTGPAAATAASHYRGAKLAVQQINATSKDLHVVLDIQNDAGDPSTAVSAAQKLVGDSSVDAITGLSLSTTGVALLPIVAQDGMANVFMQLATLPKRPPNVFSLSPSRAPLATMTVNDVVAPAHVKSAGLIYDADNPVLTADATAFRSALKAKGIKISSDQGASETTTDFSSQVTKALASNPQAIGIACLPPSSGTIVQELRSHGFKGMIFGQQAMDSSAFRQVAGSTGIGAYIFTFWDAAVPTKQTDTFNKLYKKAYPSAPAADVFSAQGWDGVEAIAQAAERIHSTDRAKLLDAIEHGSFNGVEQQKIAFGSDGFAKLSGYVVRLTKNSSVVVAPKSKVSKG